MPRTFDENDLGAHLERIKKRLTAIQPDPTRCPMCQDRGYALVMAPEGFHTGFCECPIGQAAKRDEDQRKLNRLFEDAGIPMLYQKASLADFVNLPPAVSKGIADALEEGRGIVAHGPAGTGKTHAAIAILRSTMEKGQTGLFCKVPGLLNKIRQCFDLKVPISTVTDPVRACGLLVLDDFGVESDSPWVQETVYDLIDYRYSYALPMIITTNLTQPQMVGRFGPRITSRLTGCCRWVHFTGMDRRG